MRPTPMTDTQQKAEAMEHGELIARLEAAKSGRKELDGIYATAVGWFRVQPRHTANRKGGWISPEDFMGADSDGRPRLDSLHGTSIYRDPPSFTTSLSAISNHIERYARDGGWAVGKRPSGVGWARVFRPSGPENYAEASSPALALCIAFLRALRTQDQGDQTNGS